MKLEDNMTWKEIGFHVLSKISQGLKPSEHKDFIEWFMLRENVGYLFDPMLVLRCYKICQELKNDEDHLIVISGKEGRGKSTLAAQIGAWISPDTFSLDYFCFTGQQYIDILARRAKESEIMPTDWRSICLDEGTELLGRDTKNKVNSAIVKTLFLQRALKFATIMCIPNFHDIDKTVRVHRCKTLIQVLDKGRKGNYKGIIGTGIIYVADKGHETKQINTVKIKNGTFWHGHFSKEFPKTLDAEKYKLYKKRELVSTLEELSELLGENRYTKLANIARDMGIGRKILVQEVESGNIEGKKIRGMWYLTQNGINSLANLDKTTKSRA